MSYLLCNVNFLVNTGSPRALYAVPAGQCRPRRVIASFPQPDTFSLLPPCLRRGCVLTPPSLVSDASLLRQTKAHSESSRRGWVGGWVGGAHSRFRGGAENTWLAEILPLASCSSVTAVLFCSVFQRRHALLYIIVFPAAAEAETETGITLFVLWLLHPCPPRAPPPRLLISTSTLAIVGVRVSFRRNAG